MYHLHVSLLITCFCFLTVLMTYKKKSEALSRLPLKLLFLTHNILTETWLKYRLKTSQKHDQVQTKVNFVVSFQSAQLICSDPSFKKDRLGFGKVSARFTLRLFRSWKNIHNGEAIKLVTSEADFKPFAVAYHFWSPTSRNQNQLVCLRKASYKEVLA